MAPKAASAHEVGPETRVIFKTLCVVVAVFVAGALYGERRVARLEMRDEMRGEAISRQEFEVWWSSFKASNAPSALVIPPFPFKKP